MLLKFWAYFNSEDVWYELLRHTGTNSKEPEWISQLTRDEASFQDAMNVLSNHGLVESAENEHSQVGSRRYSINGCIHAWVVHLLNKEWDWDLARAALRRIASQVRSEGGDRCSAKLQRLLPHARRYTCGRARKNLEGRGLKEEVHQIAKLYSWQGRFVEAEDMYQLALKEYDPNDIQSFDIVQGLGIVYKKQGKLHESERMFQCALNGQEEGWYPADASTLGNICELAFLYSERGMEANAERLIRRARQVPQTFSGKKALQFRKALARGYKA